MRCAPDVRGWCRSCGVENRVKGLKLREGSFWGRELIVRCHGCGRAFGVLSIERGWIEVRGGLQEITDESRH